MYQSFETPSHNQGAERLKALRAELDRQQLSGFIVPRSDAHRGEDVPARDERLLWMTGFTGSAGSAIVLPDRAAVFVDGRYTIQAAEQIDKAAFEIVQIPQDSPAGWLAENAGAGAVIGYDPWLMSAAEIERFSDKLNGSDAELKPLSANPVDAIWKDQPAPPRAPISIYQDAMAGKSLAQKREEIAGDLNEEGVQSFVLSLPDSINWLLNIRGDDIAHMPVVLGFAVLHVAGEVDLYIDPDRFDEALRAHLGKHVRLYPPEGFVAALGGLKGRVGVDQATIPVAVTQALEEAGVSIKQLRDPCQLPKARKNAAELSGCRQAHLRDGAALVSFLHWFDENAPGGSLDEIEAAKALEGFRADTGELRGLSFDTISAFGPNAALPHYRASLESNRPIKGDGLYLVDSGGQYLDGTTDVTRTVAVGTPSPEMILTFTLVLKGMIAVSRQRFPKGTSGVQIDTLARMALWQEGFDFDHGTGHGVGAYLGVHEGPVGLSKRSHTALEAGMLLSNEPAYYKEGAFGIRTENLLIVTEADIPQGGDREMLGFETVTLAPIDRRLIDTALLSAGERCWLNAYHQRVFDEIAPLVEEDVKGWLEQACAPLGLTA